MITTTTPTATAERLARDLQAILEAIRTHFVDQVATAVSATTDRHDFGPARQIVADSEHIAACAERWDGVIADVMSRMRLSDGLGYVIFELAGSGPVDAVLEDLDPERQAASSPQVQQ